jgi:ADP-ribosylglycohydrolase
MRTAPFGFLQRSSKEIFDLAVDCARLTHGHPSGFLTAGALALIISDVAREASLREAVHATLPFLEAHEHSGETTSALKDALELSLESNWRERLPELGEGWVAEEALAIAVLCALSASSPEECIIAAVNHTGDSDSTGAIAGNIVGAIHGPEFLAQEWLDKLEARDLIETLANDLASVVEQSADADQMWDRYPGH